MKKKVSDEEFQVLLDKYDVRYIIQLHIDSRITLKSKHLDYLIEVKNYDSD